MNALRVHTVEHVWHQVMGKFMGEGCAVKQNTPLVQLDRGVNVNGHNEEHILQYQPVRKHKLSLPNIFGHSMKMRPLDQN